MVAIACACLINTGEKTMPQMNKIYSSAGTENKHKIITVLYLEFNKLFSADKTALLTVIKSMAMAIY